MNKTHFVLFQQKRGKWTVSYTLNQHFLEYPGWGARRQVNMLRRNMSMSRPSRTYVVPSSTHVHFECLNRMSRLSCVQKTLCPDFHSFKKGCVKSFLRLETPMSRLSCVHFFPERVILNTRRHPSALISICAYLLWVWDLAWVGFKRITKFISMHHLTSNLESWNCNSVWQTHSLGSFASKERRLLLP